ncbi:hypothetical protein K402DRAFT_396378 [Aulographum hederae CBS 113979]|uniref:LITAF domain-containing protein n=1 Tax=Aulographum hederae CBS 113979 TaxID=1176131 RepID=A0A6G1GRP8_9PEZI|nr:hypothetical protein K402DRAFT_396378 [Aulographum hederae CBS 113979]
MEASKDGAEKPPDIVIPPPTADDDDIIDAEKPLPKSPQAPTPPTPLHQPKPLSANNTSHFLSNSPALDLSMAEALLLPHAHPRPHPSPSTRGSGTPHLSMEQLYPHTQTTSMPATPPITPRPPQEAPAASAPAKTDLTAPLPDGERFYRVHPPYQDFPNGITYVENLRGHAVPTQCPKCGGRAVTITKGVIGKATHTWAAIFSLDCLPCVPYLTAHCKDIDHYCAKCGEHLATWEREPRGKPGKLIIHTLTGERQEEEDLSHRFLSTTQGENGDDDGAGGEGVDGGGVLGTEDASTEGGISEFGLEDSVDGGDAAHVGEKGSGVVQAGELTRFSFEEKLVLV